MIKLHSAVIFVLALCCVQGDESYKLGVGKNSSATAKIDPSKFKCKNGYQEIAVYKRGDGNPDCDDSSDEDAGRTGNHTLLYLIYRDTSMKKDFLKGIYVSNNSVPGEFQIEIPSCFMGWKILYADRSHVHLQCFGDDVFQIISVARDGSSRNSHNFTLEGGKDSLLGFLTNCSTGRPLTYFKYVNASSTFIKVCSDDYQSVEKCPNFNYNNSKQPEFLIFSAKNNGTLFWLENKESVVKYSLNKTSATIIVSDLSEGNHLTKDAATNLLYVQIIADNKYWIQSFNINGEQLKRVRRITGNERKQFAVHNNVLYLLNEKSISSCNTSRTGCPQLDLHINVTSNKYNLIDTIYVYDYQTNLEEEVSIAQPLDRRNTLLIYAIIGMVMATLLFVILAYVMGRKKGERTQSMDIHDDIITGTLRKKPAYCEESLLSKGNDPTERAES